MFAKLLAIIEGRAKGDGNEGAEKLFKHSANGIAAADPAAPKARSAAAGLLATEKTVFKKVKDGQKESSDIIVADANMAVANDRIRPAKLAGKQFDLTSRSADASTEAEESTFKADTNQKLKSRTELESIRSPEATSKETGGEMAAKAKARPESSAPSSKEANEVATKAKAGPESSALSSKETNEVATKAKAGPESPALSSKETNEVATKAKAGPESPALSSKETNEVATKAKANLNQPEKAQARPVALSSKDIEEIVSKSDINRSMHGRTAPETGNSTAASAPEAEEVMVSSRADINKPSKSRPTPEAGQSAPAPVQGKEPAATAPGKSTPQEIAARTQPLGHADEKRVEGMKAATQQVTSTSMQSEKGIFMQPGTHTVSATASAAQEQRFSTNSFMKSRKINLHHTSRADNTRHQQAGAERKLEVQAGNPRLPAMQAVESFAANMKEMTAQAESLPRSGQPLELANGQTFQTSSIESSSAMRSGHQPTPIMSNSGPWSVMAAMQQIGQAAAQGKFQLELTLTPEHLGKVQVFLDSDVNKQIQVHLVVDQPTSRQSIEQHLPVLRQALADQGLNMDSFSMASSEQGDQNPQQEQQQHIHLPTETIMANSQGGSGSAQQPQAAADSRLSIRV